MATSDEARLTMADFRFMEGDTPEDWENKGKEILRYHIGEDAFNEMETTNFKDMSETMGFLDSISDRFKRTKLDLFSCRTLSMNSPGGTTSDDPLPVGASGYLKITNNPKFPDHDFFERSRLFPVHMRHNNLSFRDDAMLDARVTCVKLSDADEGGPFDLIMHTGRVPQYYNSDSFHKFVDHFTKGEDSLRTWCNQSSVNYFGRVESIRKEPTALHSLRYYSHVTYNFTSRDGTTWLARFRLLPADGSIEDGLLSQEQQQNIWDVKRDVDSKLPTDYLRKDFHQRLEESPLQYRLQVQLVTADPDGSTGYVKNLTPGGPESLNVTWEEPDFTSSRYDVTSSQSRPCSQGDRSSISNGCDETILGSSDKCTSFTSNDDKLSAPDNNHNEIMNCDGEVATRKISANFKVESGNFEDNTATANSTENSDDRQITVDCSRISHKVVSDYRNPCIIWDSPWLDFAVMTITTKLPSSVLARTKFNLDNHVPTCSPVEAKSARDFGSLSLALREFHGVNGYGDDNDEMTSQGSIDAKYKISVVTGRLINAGTDADVSITVTGTRGRTRPMNLDQRLRDDFEAGQTDVFDVAGAHVGEPLIIEMTLSSVLRNRRWFLEEVSVVINDSQTAARFTCYQWLTSLQPSVILCRCQALPPQMERHVVTYLHRKHELAVRRQRYPWYRQDGMPGRININKYADLPRDGGLLDREHELDLWSKYMRTLANTGTGTLSTLLGTWDIFTDNPKLLTKFLKDKSVTRWVIQNWEKDEEFGRQILNGPHPVRIQRLLALPQSLEGARPQIQALIDRDMDLDQAIEEGYVYMLCYPELDNLKRATNYKGKYDRHTVSPLCLLYVNRAGKCLPLAINLEIDGPVWTPRDAPLDWQLAKMWVRHADAQVHQVASRHMRTQLLSEAVAMATLRNLATSHPVYKLLYPHVKHTIAVNVMGRQLLYPAEDGLFDKYLSVGGQHIDLVKAAYRNFHIDDLHLPTNLVTRGVHDVKLLPGYYYRDDGLLVWGALEKYLRTALYLHYYDDAGVRADEEVQAWIRDLSHNGLIDWGCVTSDDVNSHGIPDVLTSLEQLLYYLTIFVFTASAQHAALSSGMMDYYSFVPNAPTMMMAPPRVTKGGLRPSDMKKALPSRGKTAEIIAACYTLSRHGKHEVYLNDSQDHEFSDAAAMSAAQHAFIVDLERISEKIHQRNTTIDVPYTYLLPEKIPKTISV